MKREKTLALAEDSAKGQFSRELVEVAWRRMFWTRNYYRRVELRRSQQDIDDSWHKLMDSIADWSSRYMVFVNTVQQYYGDTDKGKQLQGIQEQFLALEERLVALRAAESGTDNRQLVQNIRETVDDLNTKLYFFVLNKNP